MVKIMLVIVLVLNMCYIYAHDQEIDMVKEKHLYDYLVQEGKKINVEFHDLNEIRNFLTLDIDTPDEKYGVAYGVMQLKILFVFKAHLIPTEENLVIALSKPEKVVRSVLKLCYESPREEALDLLSSVPVVNLERRAKALEECYITTHDANIKKKTVLELHRIDKTLFAKYARYFLHDPNIWLEGKVSFLSIMTHIDKSYELPDDVLRIIKHAVRKADFDRPFDNSLISLIAAYIGKEKISDMNEFISKLFFDEEIIHRKPSELKRQVNNRLAKEKTRQVLETKVQSRD